MSSTRSQFAEAHDLMRRADEVSASAARCRTEIRDYIRACAARRGTSESHRPAPNTGDNGSLLDMILRRLDEQEGRFAEHDKRLTAHERHLAGHEARLAKHEAHLTGYEEYNERVEIVEDRITHVERIQRGRRKPIGRVVHLCQVNEDRINSLQARYEHQVQAMGGLKAELDQIPVICEGILQEMRTITNSVLGPNRAPSPAPSTSSSELSPPPSPPSFPPDIRRLLAFRAAESLKTKTHPRSRPFPRK